MLGRGAANDPKHHRADGPKRAAQKNGLHPANLRRLQFKLACGPFPIVRACAERHAVKTRLLAKKCCGPATLSAPSGPQFDAVARAICSLRASVFCPEDSLPASPPVRAVEQPGVAAGVAAEVADVQPLARELALAGAVVVVPAVAAAAQASWLPVRVARLESALAGAVVVPTVAATVRA